MTSSLRSLALVAAALAAVSFVACTPSEGGPTGTAGTSATGTAGTSATGAAGTGAAGTSATGAAGTSATGAAGTSATGAAGTGAAGTGAAGTGAAGTGAAGTGAAGAGAAGTGAGGTGPNKVPMCITEFVMDGVNRATGNYIECDVEAQAIDFDVAANYATNRMPGYDPAMTPISFTDFGTAFSGYAVQLCHPYCYKGNLTVGVEFNPATPAGLKGEVLFDFPQTGLNVPIAMGSGRASLGWIFLDGPALPAGATIKGEMVLKTKAKGVIVANNGAIANVTLKKWFEFKYFPIQNGFAAADLIDVTSIGFRFTMAGTAAAWSGVVYADHFQLRK